MQSQPLQKLKPSWVSKGSAVAKSKNRKNESKKNSQVDSEASALGHNPFAGLSALGGTLPEQVLPVQVSTEPRSSVAKTNASASGGSSSEFPGKLVVRREVKGRAGKTVTRLSGIAPGKLAELAKRMKKALGCGAVVEGADIVLLGSLVDRAAAWLEKAGAKEIVKGN